MTLNSKLLGGTGFALLALSLAAPAQAQTTAVYGGGGTLAEKVYRDIYNCYGNQAGGDTTANLGTFPTNPAAHCSGVAPFNSNVEPLYVGVGSGNGKSAYINHDSTKFITSSAPDNPPVPSTRDFGPFYGTGTGAGWVQAASSTNHFPKVHFVGSDDPLVAGDIATYGSVSSGHWGAPIQVPALITTVTIPFNKTADWTGNPKIKIPTGGSSNLQLSTNTLCGIFTGQITDWSDSHITTDNKGVKVGSGAITVFYRNSGSGTTFLTSNALVHQCAETATFHVPASWQTAGTASQHNNPGVGDNSWFINVVADPGNLIPAAAHFVAVSGSGGVKTNINNTPGGIGYLSPDFAKPIDSTGPIAANVQSYLSLHNGTNPAYKAPTSKAGTSIFAGVAGKAPSFAKNSCTTNGAAAPLLQATDGICAHNPLNWGVTNPTPVSGGAYPIGGFTFIDLYTCYASATDRDAVAAKSGALGLFAWYFGNNGNVVKTELTGNGFSAVPGGWLSGAKKLITTDQVTAVGIPGQAKTGCASVQGGA